MEILKCVAGSVSTEEMPFCYTLIEREWTIP
jgi:hypothetical protein